MTEQKNQLDPEQVTCEVCLKEIPLSEAKSEEASDYFIYYCSLDCYAKWKEKEKNKEQD